MPVELRLICAECGQQSDDGARGWEAYWTDDEPPEVVAFCPVCARREFGDRG